MEQTGTIMWDALLGELIGIARAVDGNEHLLRPQTDALVRQALIAAGEPLPDARRLAALKEAVLQEKQVLVPGCFACAAPCGRTAAHDMARLKEEPAEVQAVKEQLLTRLLTAATEAALPASALYPPLFALGWEGVGGEELRPFADELEAALAKSR